MKDTPLRSAEHLGSAIRLKRKEKGLSQNALAERLGVERKWVIRLEAGNHKAEFALVLQALDLVGLRVLLRDPGSSDQKKHPEPSRLDEVFEDPLEDYAEWEDAEWSEVVTGLDRPGGLAIGAVGIGLFGAVRPCVLPA